MVCCKATDKHTTTEELSEPGCDVFCNVHNKDIKPDQTGSRQTATHSDSEQQPVSSHSLEVVSWSNGLGARQLPASKNVGMEAEDPLPGSN
jgi:hypothetical protein